MTTNQEYWQRRYLQTKAKEIRNTEAYERALQPQLDGLFRELSAGTSKWVDKYAKNQEIDSDAARKALTGIHTKHWELTLKQFREKAKAGGYEDELDAEYFRSRVARLQSLEQQLRSYAQPHAQELTKSMRKALADQYNDTYMRTNYNLQAQRASFSADFARFNDAQLRIAVSQPWGQDGKDFSQRIWKNYQQELPSYLMDTVLRGTIMGYGPQKVTQMMHARFQDVKRNSVHRLVVSEMAHVAEEASAKAYEENEIEQYEYMATLESHTCDICARLDGQVFKLSERRPGINYPIIHGRCRCTTVPYIKGLPEVGERWSRDPETGKGKLIKNVSYREWLKQVKSDKMKTNGNRYTAAMLKPRPDKYFDAETASRDGLQEYLRMNFGMDLKETSRTKLSDFAIRETAKMVGQFKDLYQALPAPIPFLRALPKSEAKDAIAWYSSYFKRGLPVELGLNVKYFKDAGTLKATTRESVKVRWFSNNADENHVMMHEFSHHLDSQLTRVSGGKSEFSTQLFKILREKDNEFSIRDIGRYAYESYTRQHDYAEPFAELFTEAYGPTPGKQALLFKEEFEKLALEVLNDDASS